MKFDVVIGNPPYQDNIDNRGEQPSIYHYFYDLAYAISNQYCLISPARFLFNVGSTPKNWNKKMLNDKNIQVIYFNQHSEELFPQNDIKGGIAILYMNKDRLIGPIGTFISHNELNSLIKKVIQHDHISLGEILYGNTSYRYSELLWVENSNLKDRVSGGSKRYLASSAFDKLEELFEDKKINDDYIEIFGRQKNRTSKWMKRKYLKEHPNMDKYKVLLPSSNGSGILGETLSSPFIAKPNQGYTETYISFGAFEDIAEAKALLKYLKTKFARTMLGVLKVTQGNKTKETWSKVPLQDFTPNSDIDWTKSIEEIDRQLYKKYNLSQEEIAFIEEKVKAME